MPPIVSHSTTNIMESSNINIGGSVAARIARHQPSSTSTTSTSSSSTHDDGYGEYRNLCELRIRRLERYKKAKSFCSLDSDDSMSYGNLATAHSSTSTSNIACSNPSPLHSASTSTCSTISSSDSATLSPANSTQQLSINTRPVSTSSGSQSAFESQVELLKQKMISLMENDVSLLQKLVALGETIQELKTAPSNNIKPSATTTNSTRPTSCYRPRSLHRTSSETSISSAYADEEDDDFHPLESSEAFSQSMSAITRLYVDNNNKCIIGDDEDDEIQPNVQYFSRKNSVLRIPIPPRSSNRMIGNSKRALRRPSQLLRQCPPRLLSSEDSGHSSSSDSTTPPLQPSPKIFNDGTSTVSSTLSSSTSSSSTRHPLYDIQECGVGGINSKSSRRSNTSVDSGIRDSANSSPTPFVTNVKMLG